jgi:putative glutathione S-transferase
VSYACPWAHRALITRKLKGLENAIGVSVVHPEMLENSWSFRTDFPETTGDELYGLKYLYELYQLDDPEASTKVTVPVLWDKETKKIVNNESSEIIRILNEDFGELAKDSNNLYPEALREEIDEINNRIYETINNGVYKTGFAKNQDSYEKAFVSLFCALDSIEDRLKGRDFLVGECLTEADIRLVTTLLRFDCVYFVHFKCNNKRIADYPHLSRYMKRLYSMSEIRETTNFAHIKHHYYFSHDFLNPNRIVPLGPKDPLSL